MMEIQTDRVLFIAELATSLSLMSCDDFMSLFPFCLICGEDLFSVSIVPLFRPDSYALSIFYVIVLTVLLSLCVTLGRHCPDFVRVLGSPGSHVFSQVWSVCFSILFASLAFLLSMFLPPRSSTGSLLYRVSNSRHTPSPFSSWHRSSLRAVYRL